MPHPCCPFSGSLAAPSLPFRVGLLGVCPLLPSHSARGPRRCRPLLGAMTALSSPAAWPTVRGPPRLLGIKSQRALGSSPHPGPRTAREIAPDGGVDSTSLSNGSGGQRSQIRAPCLTRASLAPEGRVFTVSSRGRGREQTRWGRVHQGANHVHEGPTLTTSSTLIAPKAPAPNATALAVGASALERAGSPTSVRSSQAQRKPKRRRWCREGSTWPRPSPGRLPGRLSFPSCAIRSPVGSPAVLPAAATPVWATIASPPDSRGASRLAAWYPDSRGASRPAALLSSPVLVLMAFRPCPRSSDNAQMA